MQIHGFNKTTLLDYPGIVAAGVFTGGCNFRCPFCQNADLVLNPYAVPLIAEEEILSHLAKRKNITKGICISGGEPTLQPDLRDFIIKCKNLGLLIKLDTNGYKPDILKGLMDDGLIDYVAMDIKASLSGYSKVAGVNIDTNLITRSIETIIHSSIEYEFRTTVVRELHSYEMMEEISDLIKGAGKYYIQGYVDSDRVISRTFSSYTRDELETFIPLFDKKVKKVEIRGVD